MGAERALCSTLGTRGTGHRAGAFPTCWRLTMTLPHKWRSPCPCMGSAAFPALTCATAMHKKYAFHYQCFRSDPFTCKTKTERLVDGWFDEKNVAFKTHVKVPRNIPNGIYVYVSYRAFCLTRVRCVPVNLAVGCQLVPLGPVHQAVRITRVVHVLTCFGLSAWHPLGSCFLPRHTWLWHLCRLAAQSRMGLVRWPAHQHAVDGLLWRLLLVLVCPHPRRWPAIVVPPADLVDRPLLALQERVRDFDDAHRRVPFGAVRGPPPPAAGARRV